MAKLEVVFDPVIKNPEIVVPLTQPSMDEDPNAASNNHNNIVQTRVHGILAPLMKINNINIDPLDVIDFSMKCVGVLPTLTATVVDKYNFIGAFDYPTMDNEVLVQILPAFDNAYKKMDLCFYITSVKYNKSHITISAVYKLKAFTDCNIKALGLKNTYDLIEYIAKETKLGLSSNVKTNDIDKRYIYCDNKSYKDLLEREIKYSGSDQIIYDYWIDFWNYMNLLDIRERYMTTVGPDKEDEMFMWTSGQHYEYQFEGKTVPVQTPKILTNHPAFRNKENYVKNMSDLTKTRKQLSDGVDRVYAIYNDNDLQYTDNIIQDGDVKKDIFTKYEYIGENFGDYNYLFVNKCRKAFFQKINTDTIEITTPQPTFGICRGQKVLLNIYTMNESNLHTKLDELEKEGVIDQHPETQIPLADNSLKDHDGELRMDKYVSGEYLVTKVVLEFFNGKWSNKLTLARPITETPEILIEE